MNFQIKFVEYITQFCIVHKQIQSIVVPRFRGLIVWGAIIKVLYQCQNFWYEWKGIITRNVHVHVKYESHISDGGQVTSIVKVLEYVCQNARQGYKVKSFSINGKASSQGMYMWNMKALPLMVKKLWHI